MEHKSADGIDIEYISYWFFLLASSENKCSLFKNFASLFDNWAASQIEKRENWKFAFREKIYKKKRFLIICRCYRNWSQNNTNTKKWNGADAWNSALSFLIYAYNETKESELPFFESKFFDWQILI